MQFVFGTKEIIPAAGLVVWLSELPTLVCLYSGKIFIFISYINITRAGMSVGYHNFHLPIFCFIPAGFWIMSSCWLCIQIFRLISCLGLYKCYSWLVEFLTLIDVKIKISLSAKVSKIKLSIGLDISISSSFLLRFSLVYLLYTMLIFAY